MTNPYKILDAAAIDALAQSARESQRQRHHLLWHDSPEDAVHKITMWLEPDTYVRPHQHPHDDKWEILVLLSGAVRLLLFEPADPADLNSPDAIPVISAVEDMTADGTRMVQVPARQWHTLVALEPSLIFEVKQGPLVPPSPEDFAAWAPAEGDPACADLNNYWRCAGAGEPGCK